MESKITKVRNDDGKEYKYRSDNGRKGNLKVAVGSGSDNWFGVRPAPDTRGKMSKKRLTPGFQGPRY